MRWCKNCNMPIDEPEEVTSYIYHGEVDTCRYEKVSDCYCPICRHELDDADRCACGEWKCTDDDWCEECLTTRDVLIREVVERIEEERGLTYAQALELAESEGI